MSRTSLARIFQQKLIQWILVPGLLMTLVIVTIIGINQKNLLEHELVQLSKSLSKNVDFYMDGAEDILRSVAIMTGEGKDKGIREFFEGLYRDFNRFERLILLDSNENIVAVAPRGIQGVDFPIRFNEFDSDEHVLTSPMISPHSGQLVVFLSLPVEGGGRVVAELSLDALQEFIYSFLSSERTIILTDSYGNLIVHPDRELVRTQSNIGGLGVLRGEGNSAQGEFYKSDGILYFGKTSRIPGTGWKLLVSCTADSIFQPVVTLGLIIGILVICFFILLTFALKKEFGLRVVNPMMSYIKRLSAVAVGYYPKGQSQESRFYELNEFGKVFDGMSEKVREREHELRVSKAYFQSVIDSMPSALIRVDADLMVCQCNRKANEVFGEMASESRPMKASEFFSGQKEILNAISESFELNIPRILERREVGTTSLKLYDITVFPLVGSDMKGVGVRMDDVTSRARMEEVMVQTEKMMSVGGLAAGMAHEINNPLGGILQGAQNLQRRFSPEIKANMNAAERVGCSMQSLQDYLRVRKIESIIEGIKDSGLRASSIVSNMLEFSKPGKAIITMVNVAELIDASLDLAAKDYDLKKKYDFLHIKIIRELDPELPDILCSRTEIEQVLFNLFKNAAQAMTEHGCQGDEPTIHVRTRRHDTGVVIEVEDNGPGIDQESRRRVFEPFFTTKPSDVGTGLGLSVSYFIVTQNHGGTFTVESDPGKGARFTVTLPLKKPEN